MSCNGNCNQCYHRGLCDTQDEIEYEQTDEYGNRHGIDDDVEYDGL